MNSTELVLLVLALALISAWWVWLAVFFYRQRQIDVLSERPSPYPNKQSRFEVVDGVRIHYVVEGRGPDVILLHGLAANVYTWRDVIPRLAPSARVWALDLKGFGLSDKPRDSRYDFASQAELVNRFVDLQGLEKITVVGSSMGGAIAAEMALQRPDLVAKVVMIDSPLDPTLFRVPSKPVKRLLKALGYVTVFFSPFVTVETVKFYMKNIYGTPRVITNEEAEAYLRPYMQGRAALRAFLDSTGALTEGEIFDKLQKSELAPLIIWGKNDLIVPLRFGERLRDKIPGSTLEVHPTGGHHVHEEDAPWVAGKILGFISK